MNITFSVKLFPNPTSLMLILAFFSIFSTTTSTAEDVYEPADCERQAPPSPCRKRVDIPFIRIAVLQVGMHVAASALWPEAYNPITVRKNADQFVKSWTSPPEFHFDEPFFGSDGDWWYFNVFAHGLYGSEAYLAGRVWGHGLLVSTAYAIFASFTWEYLVESWYKPPSAIDLLWTPMAGVLLGELRYWAMRGARRRIGNRTLRKTVLVLLDPLGTLERLFVDCSL